MNATARPAPSGEAAAERPGPVATPAEDGCEFRPLAFTLELQSSTALLTVLTTAVRFGCRLTHVSAAERQVTFGVLAPRQVAHRLLPCLDGLIEVLAVAELPAATPV